MGKKIVQTAGRDQLGEFAPMFAHLNDDVLFGEVWNEAAIDTKTKCIVTVVSLMASGITDSSLTYHLQNAKANGVTKEEIAAIITHATMYHHTRDHVHRLAQRLGGLPFGERSLERGGLRFGRLRQIDSFSMGVNGGCLHELEGGALQLIVFRAALLCAKVHKQAGLLIDPIETASRIQLFRAQLRAWAIRRAPNRLSS